MLQSKYWASDLITEVKVAIEFEQKFVREVSTPKGLKIVPVTLTDLYEIEDDTEKELFSKFQETINEVIRVASTMVTNPCERNRILEMQHTAR